MASPFLGIAAGLTQGLAAGAQSGVSLMQQRQQMAIAQAQANAYNISAFANSLRIPDPAVRNLAAARLLQPALGMDPNSDIGKQTLSTIQKTSDDNLAALADALPGMPKSAIQAIAADPAEMANMLYKITTQKNLQNILANLPTPENPSGSGDMGTGAPGAGGTVAAPTVGAGTPAAGTTPAIVPPAPSSSSPAIVGTLAGSPPMQVATPAITAAAPVSAVPSPALVTPSGSATAPSTNSPASTPTQAAATIQGGTPTPQPLQRIAVGKAANGSIVSWDPTTDPYVRNMQKVIAYTSAMPGVTPEIMSALNSRLTQYIDSQKFKFSQFIDMQNLSLRNKEIGIQGYNASLNRERLSMDEQSQLYHQTMEPLSELGRESHDVGTGALPQPGVVSGSPPPKSTAQGAPGTPTDSGGTGTRPIPATLAASPATPIAAPAGADPTKPGTWGKNNGDGTFTLTDASLLNKAGIHDDTRRIVYDAPANQWYMQNSTPTSLRTAGNLDDAQIGLNSAQRGYNLASSVRAAVKTSPTSFGAFGDAKSKLQTAIGIAKDISATFPTVKDMLDATGLSKLPYDPKLPTLDGVGQFLNAYVTRVLTSAGGSAGMSAYGVTKESLADLTDLGGGSSADVDAHLAQIQDLLAQAKGDFQSRLPTHSAPGVPDTTAGQPTGAQTAPPGTPAGQTEEEKSPLKSDYDAWQKMTPEQQKAAYGTEFDMRPSKWDADSAAASHLPKIPVGQVFRLQKLLNTYKVPEDQTKIKAYFNWLFGKTATAELGY